MNDHDPTPILYSEVTIFMLESSKIFGISIEIIFGGFMNNQNDNKSNALFAAIQIVLPLLLPILVPTFLIVGMKKWIPDEVKYPSIISLFALCIGFFIVGILFSIILRLCKLSEEKLEELGFLGFTLSAVSTFLSFYVGYFWLADLNFTSVELSPHAVLIFAILCTLLLEGIFKVMDMFDSSDENKAHV
ncbi:epimerase [Bacillus sp. RIT809]|nr:epimerase [Bacillus sp. RIT 809]